MISKSEINNEYIRCRGELKGELKMVYPPV